MKERESKDSPGLGLICRGEIDRPRRRHYPDQVLLSYDERLQENQKILLRFFSPEQKIWETIDGGL